MLAPQQNTDSASCWPGFNMCNKQVLWAEVVDVDK